MNSSILKYNLLNSFEQEEVKDFIDFLFSKKHNTAIPELSAYKQKIRSVSTWSDEDLKVFTKFKFAK
jgi:hypothetical protein